jgi:nucleoside-diphosphate-sugar epimerase
VGSGAAAPPSGRAGQSWANLPVVIVAITGGTGFVGQRLAAAYLARGATVRILSRRRGDQRPSMPGAVEWHEGDLGQDAAAMARFADGADVLQHCAGELRAADAMARTNLEGTRKLLDAAAGRVGRWIQLSSVGVYGPRQDGLVTEETPFAPRGPYEETKAQAEEVVRQAHLAGRVQATVLRPSIVFGPGMASGALRQWTRMIRRQLFFYIGPAGAMTHYVPVESVVEALVLCGEHPAAPGSAYNLSEDVPIETFVGWMADACGVRPPWLRVPVLPVELAARLLGGIPGFPLNPGRMAALTGRARYSKARIETELGFRPSTNLETALRAMVQATLERTI